MKLVNNEIWNGHVGLDAIARRDDMVKGKCRCNEDNSQQLATKFSKLNVRPLSSGKDLTSKLEPSRRSTARGGREKCSYYNFHQYDEPDNHEDKKEFVEEEIAIYNDIMGFN